MAAGGKKLSDSELIGDAGIALIHSRIAAMGHAWRAQNLDAGIDGSIELRDPATGEMSNRHILVQSKASNSDFAGENTEQFHFICNERDLDYWMKGSQPVLLVCSHPKSGESRCCDRTRGGCARGTCQAWCHGSDPGRGCVALARGDESTQAATSANSNLTWD